MTLDWISMLRTKNGNPLLIFGPISVTGTLLHDTPHDVKVEVRETMEMCRNRAGLLFFTNNTITPDAPLDNIISQRRQLKITAGNC